MSNNVPTGDGNNATLGTLTSGLDATTNGGSKLNPAQTAETRKIGSFPGDLSTIKPIFGLKSKNTQAKERFSQKSQEYLDSHKMSIYL